ncbi:MAG: radical SAM protein [Planctomycetaceae bacterium]|jgi:DNA repair photolyase|nr:radical SAM protein [Planctomycetaceae bacterium]
MLINEANVKHILTRSKLPGLGYAVNPYIGCQHACVYCYARFMKRFTNHEEPWGTFVDVKRNAADVLVQDLRKAKPGCGAFFGSATDAYQPCEQQYQITRSLLKIVADNQPLLGFPVSVLTKSALVLRDIDLLKRIPNASVGFSLAMPDERARALFEPETSSVHRRLEALKILRDNGIRTYCFIGPLIPGIFHLPPLFAALEGIVGHVHGETLNTRCGNLSQIQKAVMQYSREARRKFNRSINDEKYWTAVETEFEQLAAQHGIPVAGFYNHSVAGC